jgi:acetoacetyl-CoA synthetase
MGSADIYAAIEELPELADSLVIGAELPDGGYYMPLFVVLKPGAELSADLVTRIRKAIGRQVSPRRVPDEITAAPAVPRTLTGKKLGVPIKRLLQGVEAGKAVDPATVDRPAVLDWYVEFALRTRKRWAR